MIISKEFDENSYLFYWVLIVILVFFGVLILMCVIVFVVCFVKNYKCKNIIFFKKFIF